MKSIRTACGYLVQGQFRRLLAALVERVPSWMFRRRMAYLFKLHDLTSAAVLAGRCGLPGAYSFRKATTADIPACAAMSGLGEKEFQRRFENGDECYGVFLAGEPVHLLWLHFGSCYVRGLGLLLRLDVSDCYLYGVITAPPHRAKGFYKAAQRHIASLLAEKGTTSVLQVVEEGNEVPLAILPRLGYHMSRIVCHVTFCTVRCTLIRDRQGTRLSRWWHRRTPHGVFRI
jgi:hypothetical protein